MNNEFAHGLRGRFLEWHELILRPILYCILHLPDSQIPTGEFAQLAQRAVNICSMIITGDRLLMRHGGSWFIARRAFSCACQILAVVLHPTSAVIPPPNWQFSVQAVIATLRFWGREAADMRRMAAALDRMYYEAHKRTGLFYSNSTGHRPAVWKFGCRVGEKGLGVLVGELPLLKLTWFQNKPQSCNCLHALTRLACKRRIHVETIPPWYS